MTYKYLLAICLAFFLGMASISVVGKIYIDNLHYIACKMYNSIENNSQFQYVNTQFQCN